MKLRTKIILALFFFNFTYLVIKLLDGQEVAIESRESKTTEGKPVFNKIKWIPFLEREIWMMNQNHHGGNDLPTGSWDRLAIVVDKAQKPFRAQFFQFEPGPLEWSENLKQKPFRVSCFMCHNNGPRAIRPNFKSSTKPVGLFDRLKLLTWNLRVKLYGRILPHSSHDKDDSHLTTPFRFHGVFENEPLEVETCKKCHTESGFLSRGKLHRQQFTTIKFMLDSGEMPPPGFKLYEKEKNQLNKFLHGF